MLKTTVFALLVLMSLLSGCSLFQQQAATPTSEVHISKSDSTISITLKTGQGLAVSLESNPTTGYGWEKATTPNSEILQMTGAPDFVPSSNMPGAGGVATYHFKAVKAGSSIAVLGDRRSAH
jgi:inhibitor of cysteine peptidase